MKKTVTLRERSPCIPEGAKDFIAYWHKYLNKVPEAYRDTTTIEIEVVDEWQDHSIEIALAYERPETKAEIKERIQLKKVYTDKQRERDERQFEALKQKLGK